MLINLLVWCVFGLVVGALARLLMPGRDPMGCFGTIGLGISGSLLGGFLGSLMWGAGFEGFQPAGFVGALIGSLIILGLIRYMSKPRY